MWNGNSIEERKSGHRGGAIMLLLEILLHFFGVLVMQNVNNKTKTSCFCIIYLPWMLGLRGIIRGLRRRM